MLSLKYIVFYTGMHTGSALHDVLALDDIVVRAACRLFPHEHSMALIEPGSDLCPVFSLCVGSKLTAPTTALT